MPEDARRETVAVLDFGSQYSRLIARRVRECHVYCEIVRHDIPADELAGKRPRGIILSGGPRSVYEPGAPTMDPGILELGVPVLGICYGMQLMAQLGGGRVTRSDKREYGKVTVVVDQAGGRTDGDASATMADAPTAAMDAPPGIFDGLGSELTCWMSHGDRVDELPRGFRAIARTANSPYAAMEYDGGRGRAGAGASAGSAKRLIGVQFHPEVAHTPRGRDMLCNFVLKVCGCRPAWTPRAFIEETISSVRRQVGGTGRAVCALSGGVDSTVAAVLVSRAIGDRLTCVFVDNGLLRKDEPRCVTEMFRKLGLNVVHADAADRFLAALAGIVDPEQKRKVVGNLFIRVFEEEAEKVARAAAGGTAGEAAGPPPEFLVQGTLYPDVIESTAHDTGPAARIKSHHNVGGLPEDLRFSLIEPLRYLFKDEVRAVARELGLPEEVVSRQPFPGPGLAVRIIGEVTRGRLEILREADAIVEQEIRRAGLYETVWQSFAILPTMRSVGVMGDERTYAHVVVLRVVTSEDGMTCDWVRLPHDVLERISSRVVNEVAGVNRLVYDVTTKPPATIEWE